jgi:hypothetical protein
MMKNKGMKELLMQNFKKGRETAARKGYLGPSLI